MRTRPSEPEPHKWLSIREMAELAGDVSDSTVREWIVGGKLKAMDVGAKKKHVYRIRQDWATAFLERFKHSTVDATRDMEPGRLTLADIHPDAYYDAGAVAVVFGGIRKDGSMRPLSVDTVYSMASRGILRATRFGPRGGLVRFRGADILECAKERVGRQMLKAREP